MHFVLAGMLSPFVCLCAPPNVASCQDATIENSYGVGVERRSGLAAKEDVGDMVQELREH